MEALVHVMAAEVALALASSAHCAAMCGPLASTACARRGRSGARFALYTAGRVASYAAVGALAAGVGRGVIGWLDAGRATEAMAFATACALLFAAWRFARRPEASQAAHGATANAAAEGATKLVPISRAPHRAPFARLIAWPRAPLALGLATALLPCSALLSAALLASIAGTPAIGAVGMGVFALASAPAVGLAALAGGGAFAWLSRGRARAWTAATLVVVACWVGARPWLAGGASSALCRTPVAAR